MLNRRWLQCLAAGCFAAAAASCAAGNGAELLIADRLTHGIYRYSESGDYLGTIVRNPTLLNQPAGIGISPDYSQLYVSSLQNDHVVRFDYNRFTGAATNPVIFADAGDGLNSPSDILFSDDGNVIYISSLSGNDPNQPPDPLKLSGKVSRFHPDGTSAGGSLIPPQPDDYPEEGYYQVSSLSFHPDTGKLLVGAFLDSPTGTTGGIAISDAALAGLPEFFTAPSPALNGTTGLMAHDGYLYVSGMFAFSIRRINLATGELDPGWSIPDVYFPQDLLVAPDGNGFLAGILGLVNGSGTISRYSFDGAFLETFATPVGSGQEGFREATTFVAVPNGLLGDFNGNGVVDTADYTVWRNAEPTDRLLNDDSPGVVDITDYDDWRANFGNALATGGGGSRSQAVPESATVLIVAFGWLASAWMRIRR